MSKVIPVGVPVVTESLEVVLVNAKTTSLCSLKDSPYDARIGKLVGDNGNVLGTVLYVWGVDPSEIIK